MRAFFIAIIVFLLVVFGGLGVSWYMQASQAKQSLEQAIATLNQPTTYITYQSIETSGFPTHVYVTLVRPRFTGRVDTLLKTFIEQQPPGAFRDSHLAQIQALPEWDEDAQLDGSVVYGINAFSDEYTMTTEGSWNHTSKIGTQSISVSQSPGTSYCSLTLARDKGILNTLWNFKTLTRDQAAFLHDFRSVDCNFPTYTLSDSNSHQPLINSAGGRIYITSAPQGTQRQFRFYFNSKDGEITQAGDQMIALYAKALSSDAIVQKLSSYGKQNIELDFSYAGPSPSTLDGNIKDMPLDIQLNKLLFTNQLYQINGNFHLANSVNATSRMVNISLKAAETFTEQYDALVRDMIKQSVVQLYANPNQPLPPNVQAAIKAHNADDFLALTLPVIPNLHSLGNLSQTLEANYQGSGDFTNGDFTLTDLGLTATPYGITAKGSAKTAQGQPFPSASINLNCIHCSELVDDVAAYAEKMNTAITAWQPGQSAPTLNVDPAHVSGVKMFLSALAEPSPNPADKTIYSYTLVSDGKGRTMINGRTMQEVMQLYNQYVAYQPQPQAQPQAQPATH